MAKEIKLRVSLDGSGKVVGQIDDIGDGLHEMAVRDAKNAKQALDQLDRTSFNQLRSQIQSTSKQVQEFGEKVGNAGSKLKDFGQQLTVGVTLPILGLGAAAIKTFADVELAVAEVSSIKPEINTKEVLTALNEMSTRVPQTAQQLGDGLYQIFSSIEVSQAGALKLLENFARGATAAKTDASTFGTAVLGVMNAYKLSVEDAGHISDVFFNTVNLGVVNGQELAGSLGDVTQAAKNAGVSFDELGALIVGVTKEGGVASTNINNLSNFLQKLPTKEASNALKQLGVDVQIDGKFRPVIDVLTDLDAKLKTMSQSDAAQSLQKIFPDAQARTGVQTLLSQLANVKAALEVNKTTAGAADAAYQKIAGTAAVQLQLLKNTGIAILAELGSAVLPLLQPLVIWLAQNLVPAIKQAVETFKTWSPQMQTVAIAIVGVIAAIGPVLTIIGAVVIAIGGVVSAIGTIGAAVGSVSLGPVVAIFAGVVIVLGAVGVAVYALYQAWTKNIGGIQETAQEVFNNLKTIIQPAIDEIVSFVQQGVSDIVSWVDENLPDMVRAVQQIVKAIGFLWEQHGDQIKEIVSSAWTIVKTLIVETVKYIGNVIKLVVAVINGDWGKAWQVFKQMVDNGVNATVTILKSLVNIVWQLLKALVTPMISIAKDLYNRAIEIGKNIVDGLVNGISNLASRVYEKAKEVASTALGWIKSVFDVQSPSKETTKIGEFVSEGLAVGVAVYALYEAWTKNIQAKLRVCKPKLITMFWKLFKKSNLQRKMADKVKVFSSLSLEM